MVKKTFMAIAAGLFLAGCAIPSAAPEKTVTITQEAPAPIPEPTRAAPQGDDETYLGFLRSKGIYASDATSIEVGKTVCATLDKGYGITIIMAAAVDAGFTVDEGAAIIAAAVLTYCPWNESKVTDSY